MNHLLHVKYLITAKNCMQPFYGNTYKIMKNKFQLKYRFEEETSFNTFTFIMKWHGVNTYKKFKTIKFCDLHL